MKTKFLKFALGAAVASTMFLAACGDDSSGGLPSAPVSNATESSSSIVAPPSSDNGNPMSQPGPDLNESSSSTVEAVPESSAGENPPESAPSGGGYTPGTLAEEIAKDAPFVAASAANGTLIPVADLLASIQPTDRVLFVIRHGRRGSGTGKEQKLHATGVNQAQSLGAAIAAVNATDPIFYAHSDYVRTRMTAMNIFVGRGGDSTQFQSTIVGKLAGGGYVKDSDLLSQHADEDFEKNQLKVFASWMYQGLYTDTFNDLTETSVSFLTQHILPAFPPEYRIGIMVSHDMTIAPLLVYCTNKAVNFKAYENLDYWLGYVQGLAIVIAPDGSRTYYPVNGLYGEYAYLDGAINRS